MRLASDTRLVSLVREGRDGAFEAVYDRHSRGILSFCRHMLGDADEAEDAVQHTFMAAYSDLLTSEKPIHLRAWLFTIARNRCYTILRARREQPSAEIEEAATEGLASQVQRRQDLRDLVSDMRQLPEEQRAALVLAELDSLSHSDIAEVLGVPREKVKALVFQARESLLASRTARDTACAEIREQLACGRGATLRRANLRRHLRDCDGCRAFRAQVERQRRQFAVLLPVVPGIALKEAVLGGTGATAVGAGAISGGAIATGALKGGALKGIVGAVLASVGTAGTLVVAAGNVHMTSLLHDLSHSLGTSTVTHRPAPQRSATASTGAAGAGASVALALQRSGLASGSSHVTGGAKAASGSSLGSAVLPALTPTRHVRVAHEQRLQAPFVKHHRRVKWAHAPVTTTAPTSSTPSTSTSSTPVSSAPVSSAPTSSAPVTTASTVASTPVTKTPTTTSTPSSPTGVVRTPAPTTVVTPPHVSVAPVTASPRTTTGVTRATTVVTAVGTGSGSRYGSGSGGSTGEGSGSSSGTTSAATTSTTSTTSTSTSTGTSTTGGTRGSGGTTTTTSTGTSTGTTTTPVIGGSSDSSTTTSTTPAGSGTSTTSTTPGRTLEGSPS